MRLPIDRRLDYDRLSSMIVPFFSNDPTISHYIRRARAQLNSVPDANESLSYGCLYPSARGCSCVESFYMERSEAKRAALGQYVFPQIGRKRARRRIELWVLASCRSQHRVNLRHERVCAKAFSIMIRDSQLQIVHGYVSGLSATLPCLSGKLTPISSFIDM